MLLTSGVPAVVVTVVMSALGLLLALRNKEQAIPITILTALVASPLSWPLYSIVALPVAALWWRGARNRAYLIVAAPLVLWMFMPIRWIGHFGAAALLILLVGVYRVPETRPSGPSREGQRAEGVQ